MWKAAARGDMHHLSECLARGADINSFQADATALMCAVRYRQSRVVQFLLEKRADVNVMAEGTVMHEAAFEGAHWVLRFTGRGH
jgi:ankyrin repeat protein